MGEHIENDEIYYYYDSHVTEKDLMGEPSNHSKLVHYLWDVLLWLFHGQQCAIYKNWSVHLNSFLASEGAYLRLYDKNRQQCLTRAAAMQTKADAMRVDIQVKRIKAMEEKLRSLGIDPDQL